MQHSLTIVGKVVHRDGFFFATCCLAWSHAWEMTGKEYSSDIIGDGHLLEDMRIATQNCVALIGKLDKLCITLDEQEVDTICLQETRVSPDSIATYRKMAKAHGYKIIFSDCHWSKAGVVDGGLAVMSKRPLQ